MGIDTSTSLTQRRSVRSYKPDPVPDDLLRELLTEARWAPSAINTQSTWVYALAGEALDTFKAGLKECAESETPPCHDVPFSMAWPPLYKARMDALMQARTSFIAAEEARVGIQPPAVPVNPRVAGARIFGAPTVLVLAFDKAIGEHYACFDAALLAMSITLAAHARGLGTCIMLGAISHPDLLRKAIPGTDEKNFVAAIALGYPDWDAPVNRFPRSRVPVDEFLTIVR